MEELELKNYEYILTGLKDNNLNNHLLLGNGFNIGLGVNTSYENIFNEMKDSYKGYGDLKLHGNYDIEDIIGKLKDQINDGEYKKFLDKFINNKVKSDFMKSAYGIAKDGIKNIYQDKNHGIGILFKNFTNFFTLNYDPFLYLLLMKYKKLSSDTVLSFQNTFEFKKYDLNIRNNDSYKEIKDIYSNYSKDLTNKNGNEIINNPFSQLSKTDLEKQLREVLKIKGIKYKKEYMTALYEELKEDEISLNTNDGFTKELFNTKPAIGNYIQNVFFLHGAFHIYKDKNKIYKITKIQNKALYERLDEILGEESKDIVSVFTNDNKISEIEENDYLIKGIHKLKTLEGSLVIIGSSLDNNDEHIFGAINKSSLNSVFYASNDNEKTQHYNRLTELFPNKDIALFDRDTISYEKPKENN